MNFASKIDVAGFGQKAQDDFALRLGHKTGVRPASRQAFQRKCQARSEFPEMQKTLAAAALWLGMSPWVGALPEGSQVIRGGVQVTSPQSHILEVLQSTPQAIVNWNSFNVQLGETVRFLQPGAQAVLLNRVVGGDPSHILGQITATGQVFLVNPNGILFGPNSVVNAGSFVASTLDIHDQDFIDKRYQFQAVGDRPLAGLTQQGHLEVAPGGFLVLLSPLLDQQGVLVARQGTVQLGATSRASLSVDAQGLLSLALPQASAQAGTVLLSHQQMSDTLSQVVSAPNLVEAGDIVTTPEGIALVGAEGVLLHQGQIEADRVMLNSTQATVLAPGSQIRSDGGRIDALSRGTTFSSGHISNPEGFVEISGSNFLVNTPVDVGRNGTLFLDPGTLRVTNGAGSDGSNPFEAVGSDATVNAAVLAGAAGSVILQADDDIIVESDVNLVFANSVDVLFDAGRDIVMEGASSLAASNSASTIRFEAGRSVALNDVLFNNVEVEVASGNSESFLRGDLGRPGSATSVNISVPNLTIPAQTQVNVLGSTAQVDLTTQINFVMDLNSLLTVPGGTVNVDAQSQLSLFGSMNGTAATQFDLQSVDGVTMAGGTTIRSPQVGSRVSLRSDAQILVASLEVPEIEIVAPTVISVGPNTWGAIGLPLQVQVSGHNLTVGGAGPLDIEGTLADVNLASNTTITNFVGIRFGDTPGNLNVTSGTMTAASNTEISGSSPVNVTYQGGRIDLVGANVSLPSADSSLDIQGTGAILLGNVTVGDSLDAQTSAGNVRIFGEVGGNRVNLATPDDILGLTPAAQITGLEQLELSAGHIYGLGPQQTLALATGATAQVILNISGANFPDAGPPELPTPEGFAGSVLFRFPQSSNLTVNAVNDVRVVNEPAPAPEPTTTITSRQDLSPETQAVVTAQLAQSQVQIGNLPPATVDLNSGDWEGLTHTNEGLTSFYAASPSSMVVETVVLSPEASSRSSERRERVASATLQVLSEEGESDDDVKFWRALIERVLIWEESD